jgi:hypothetical protein
MEKIKGKNLTAIETIFPYVRLRELCPDYDEPPGSNVKTPLKKEITDMYSFFSV